MQLQRGLQKLQTLRLEAGVGSMVGNEEAVTKLKVIPSVNFPVKLHPMPCWSGKQLPSGCYDSPSLSSRKEANIRPAGVVGDARESPSSPA